MNARRGLERAVAPVLMIVRGKPAGGARAGYALPDTRNGGSGPPFPSQLILTALSVLGVIAAAVLWARGHGWLALRVLSGDVLLMLVLLLLA